MRIVLIGPYPAERECVCGGVEASVLGLSKQLSLSNDVHVFDFPRIGENNGAEYDGKVLVHRFCNTGKRQISTSRQVKTMAKEICILQPEACHIHGTGLFSWLMFKRLKKEGMGLIVTVHGLIRVEKRNLLKKKLTLKRIAQYYYQGSAEKRFLSQCSVAIADTEYVKEMVNNYPIRKRPDMYVIPQGINEDFFSLNCSPDSDVFLSVGAIVERKGHLMALKAFERVRKEGVGARLIIAGTVASQSYLLQLKEFVCKSDYQEDIAIYTDLPDKEIKELYKRAHVFVLHSEEESQGIVFAEAMASGLPIVSTKVGGVPYVVEHGKNGLLSAYGDVEAFANSMRCLMEDVDMWQCMSDTSKQMAQKYHWASISERIMHLYQSVEIG